SLKTSHYASTRLEAGMVNVNHFGIALPETPLGGIKDSGVGSEGGSETFDAYVTTKFISEETA
ncbi:aldehyde dehydrogenase family protein, partial [Klebsiella pneumoniae]|nr:aldehyde dehydrogenase family protein [Klebsiella pneumoniae]